MKVIASIALCLFVGLSASAKIDRQREQLVYKVRGETVVGIPLNETQGQAVHIEQTVRITRHDQRTFILQARNIVVNGLKNELSDAGGNSQSSSSESSSQSSSSEETKMILPPRIREILESPIEVVVTSQKVSAFRVQAGTPRWARNIFRGLITQFHFIFEQMGNLPVGGAGPENEFEVERQRSLFGTCPTMYKEYNLGPVGTPNAQVAEKLQRMLQDIDLNQSNESGSSSSSESNSKSSSSSSSEEKNGKMSSSSSSSSSSSESSEELEQRLPRMVKNFDTKIAEKMCEQGDNYMVIAKVLNLTGCERVAALSMGHPAVELNNTNPLYQRQVVILNFGCGMGPGDFKLLGVLGADSLNVGFISSELPSLKQVTTQIAQLKEIIQGQAQGPSHPVEIRSIQYEFTNERFSPYARSSQEKMNSRSSSKSGSDSDSDSQSSEDNNQDEINGDLEHPGVSALILDPQNRSQEELAKILKELLRQITKEFRESSPQDHPVDVHRVMDKFRTVVRIIRVLERRTLVNIYSSLVVEGQSTNNRGLYTLYFNALLIAGSQPSLATCDQLLRNNNIDATQKAHYLLSFPKYARRPTKELIRMFKATVEKVLRDEPKVLQSTAMLSLASITYQACVNSRIAQAKYPVELAGRYCGPKFAREEVFSFLGEKLWPKIMASGSDEQKAVIIGALGVLGLPEMLPHLDQVIRDEKESVFVRTKATFAIKRLIQSENGNDAVSKNLVVQTVIPQLMRYIEIYPTPATVQMAAGSLVFVSEHSTQQQWGRIASFSIHSRNPEIMKFVHTGIKSIAEMKHPVNKNHKRMKHIAQSLRSSLNSTLSQAHLHGKAQSINIFTAEDINENAELGFYGRFGLMRTFAAPLNFVNAFVKGSYELGPSPIPVAPLGASVSVRFNSKAHPSLAKVYAQLSMWNSMFLAGEVNAQTLETIAKSTDAGRLIAVWMSAGENNAVRNNLERINVQKAIQPIELMKEVPTLLGYPAVFRTSTPVIFSTVGRVGVKGSQGNSRLQADLYLSLAAQKKARLSVKVPYIMIEIQAGFEKNLALELPIRVVIQKGSQGELSVAVTPTHLQNQGQPKGEIRLASLGQVPFIAVVKDQFALSLKEKYEEWQAIRTGKKPSQTNVDFGQDDLGLKFVFEEEKDRPSVHSKKFEDVLYKNQNFTLDIEKSRTNTVVFTFASGQAKDSKWQQSGSSSESSESQQKTGKSSSNEEAHIKNGYVIVGAITGKKNIVQSLEQTVTNVKDVTGQNQGQGQHAKSTFQLCLQADFDRTNPEEFSIKVAAGNAANQAAKNMPNFRAAQAVKEAITQAENSQEQPSACVEFDHESQDKQSSEQKNSKQSTSTSGSSEEEESDSPKWNVELRYGKTCDKLQALKVKPALENFMKRVHSYVETKDPHQAAQLKAALRVIKKRYGGSSEKHVNRHW